MPGTRETNNKLLAILQHYAPTSKDQQTCSKMLWQMELDGLSYTEIDKQLASALITDLRYGNWPWVLPEDRNCMCIGFSHQPWCKEFDKNHIPY
jgi:hypothetical protein